MNYWVEERCEALRLALQIPMFPTERDLDRLVEWLGKAVVVRSALVNAPQCALRDGQPPVISMPRRLHGRAYDLALAHELGHVLLSLGIGELLRHEAQGDRRILRLAAAWQRTDEANAREFVGAWLLPSALVSRYRYDLRELVEVSDCDPEFVQRRVQSLQGRVVRLASAPRWSAYHNYHVVCQHARRGSHVFVAAKGSTEPLFSFHVRQHEAEPLMWQLAADLCALTPEEFARKHAEDRSLPPQVSRLDVSALQASRGGCDVA